MEAKRLPELRSEQVGQLTTVKGHDLFVRAQTEALGMPLGPGERERLWQTAVTTWRDAELFFVTGAMSEVAKAAARTMPEFTIQPQDLPAEQGVIYFDSPIGENSDGQRSAGIIACAWTINELTYEEYGTRTGVFFTFHTSRADAVQTTNAALAGEEISESRYRDAGMAPLPHDDDAWVMFGDDIPKPDTLTSQELWARTVTCAWILMQQPIATVSVERADRASRRRLAKQSEKDSPIRVIALRHAKSQHVSRDESEREYHHQWVVRGHWRQQWYPSEERNKPRWIAPHVKGPEGAPLLGGEKVYAWKR